MTGADPRPHLLFVSPRFLFPLNEGGKIRTANTLRAMKGGAFRITLASPAPADAATFAADLEGTCDEFLGWRPTRYSQAARLLALPGRVPVSVATDRSLEGRLRIEAFLAARRPDLVLADFPHANVLLPKQVAAPTVMFTHNVEAEIFRRHAARARGLWALVWRDQARKMRRFEQDVLRRFGTVIAVSARDAELLRREYALPNVVKIETGVDLDYYARLPLPARPRADTLLFTGVLDSPANIDGMTLLMDEIWPLIARVRPDAKALIVGRNPAPHLIAAASARGLPWCFTGSVPDIRPHVAEGDVAVIPLRVGSGTRIKAFEAMAMGRPVVSTRVGVEGLDIEPGTHYLAADTPAEFAAAVLRVLDDPVLRDRLVDTARTRLEERSSWATIGHHFEAICLEALKVG